MLEQFLSALHRPGRTVAAIDGNSAAGKSTLSAMLKERYSAAVIRMDDFFLRPFQRTPERLGEPGGNIDYERFSEEVIEPLKAGRQFTYRPYDCRKAGFSPAVTVTPGPLTVVEGVYSLHPRFAGAYDITVFLSLGEDEQRRRLAERDPHLLDRFIREWIPMENRYFDAFNIRRKCDFVIDCTSL
jgi:uridine kinase